MKAKKVVSLLLALGFMMALLAGCNNSKEEEEATTVATEKVLVQEGPAVNTNADKDTLLLVVSFGTSFNDSRSKTIGGIEDAIVKAFPQYQVRRAFTSQIIIDKLLERDGIDIDNVTEALERAAADGYKNLVVQPTHLMDGFEYNDVLAELEKYSSQFDSIKVGLPLLQSDEDFQRVIAAITDATKKYDDGETAIVFMGHGTEAESNGVYAKLQEKVTEAGYKNTFIGTVEATPDLNDVLNAAKAGNYKKVVLQPLMVVAGDHANNDMAGDEDDSWKSAFEAAGFEVTTVLEGLGQNEAVQQIYVDHVKAVIGG